MSVQVVPTKDGILAFSIDDINKNDYVWVATDNPNLECTST